MRDQIGGDVAVGAAKAAPAVVTSVYAQAQGMGLADIAVIATIIYTTVLTLTTLVRHWGEWSAWTVARWATLKRFWRWLRG